MPQSEVTPERDLIARMAAGRAVLLLGQDHSPAQREVVLRDIAAVTRGEQQGSMRDQLVDRASMDDLANVRRALARHSPSAQLREVAANPWSLVVTSAVDPAPVDALREGTLGGRRLRLLFPTQSSGRLVSRDTLTVVRLFGSLDEQEERYLPPLTSLALRKRRSFEVASVLQQLPSYVGPHGCLVVTGVRHSDWLGSDAVALALGSLPAGAVHWFGDRPDSASVEDLGDVAVFHEASLADVVERARDSEEGQALARAKRPERSGDRTISFAGPGQKDPVVLSAADWRNIAQVGVLLDDGVLAPLSPLGPDEQLAQFKQFLRHQQYVPDWEGMVRGYLFERELGPIVEQQLDEALGRLGSVREKDQSPRSGRGGVVSRLPFLLTGPPACGKSRLLQWLAFRLRARGHVVLYLVTPSGRVQSESVERVCRIVESKGASAVLVVADDLEVSAYRQLSEHLASAGRNAVVLGARNGPSGSLLGDDNPTRSAEFIDFVSIPVAPKLSNDETSRFLDFLSTFGYSTDSLPAEVVSAEYFLLLLYRILPDSRGPIHSSLTAEYDRILSALNDLEQPAGSAPEASSQWQEQLAQARQLLFPNESDSESDDESSPFSYAEWVRSAVDISLMCAKISKPLPLDILLRIGGNNLLRNYQEFADIIQSTGLLHEIEIDLNGTLVLDADHPVIADLTLGSVMPRRQDQLSLLERLIDAINWNEAAFPGENPDQDYCIEVLQAVAPRGVAKSSFDSPSSLETLSSLLRSVRERYGANVPRLLHLEANVLRHLMDRSAADYTVAIARGEAALEVLDVAERILEGRRPTAARNSELSNLLNTRAAVHGFLVGNYLRHYRSLDAADQDRDHLRETVFEGLNAVDELAVRSRGLGAQSYYPLDVNFWVYRDAFDMLPDLSDPERARLLERMEEVLDTATEESVEANQVRRYEKRVMNLADMEGDVQLSESLAESMREDGDFSGWCLLVRRNVLEPGSRRAKSRDLALEGLDQLEAFGSAAFESAEALDLMHRLWMSAFLGDLDLGGADPVMAACKEQDWQRWRRILESRNRLGGPGPGLFRGFCLGWTLLQVGESRLGIQEFRSIEPLSGGSRRRVGSLAVLTQQDGTALEFRGTVRRREGDALVLFVGSLVTELRVSPGMLSRLGAFPEVGDELGLEVGLNYRGLLPWRVASS